jgi:hypothetical protein
LPRVNPEATLITSGAQAVKLAEESTALGLDGETFKEPFSSQLREKIADNLGCESLNTQAGVLKQIQRELTVAGPYS